MATRQSKENSRGLFALSGRESSFVEDIKSFPSSKYYKFYSWPLSILDKYN